MPERTRGNKYDHQISTMEFSVDRLISFMIGNATDRVDVVFGKFAYSLMRRVTASPTVLLLSLSIAMHIIMSPLIDKWESMLYV